MSKSIVCGCADMFICISPFPGRCLLMSDSFLLGQDEQILFGFAVTVDKIKEVEIHITTRPPPDYQLGQMVAGNM